MEHKEEPALEGAHFSGPAEVDGDNGDSVLRKQAQVQVERVIRTQTRPAVNPQCIAVTEDGTQYGIELVQQLQDVYPPSMDLTLVRIEQKYEVPHE